LLAVVHTENKGNTGRRHFSS